MVLSPRELTGLWHTRDVFKHRSDLLAHGRFLLIPGLAQPASGSAHWPSCASQTFPNRDRATAECFTQQCHPTSPVWRDVPQNGVQWHWVCAGVNSFIVHSQHDTKGLVEIQGDPGALTHGNIGSASLKHTQPLSRLRSIQTATTSCVQTQALGLSSTW